MNITKRDLARPPKQIGTLDGKPVYEMETIGGYHIVALYKGSKVMPVSVGPHRAVSRFLAEKQEPSIKWTDLEKSAHIPSEFFQDILPEYEELSRRLRELQ